MKRCEMFIITSNKKYFPDMNEWVKQQKDTQIYLTSKVVCLLEIQFHILETFTFNFMIAAIHRIKFWW